MFCSKCGCENDTDSRYCTKCGSPLAGTAPQAVSTEPGVTDTVIDSPSAADISAGSLGPYELRGELGRGAMARVWLAWDTRLTRKVALKEPLFESSLPQHVLDEMGRRFVSEAKTAARLNHPNIVTVHSADVYDGRPVIDMELVEGETLGVLLDRGPLDSHLALDYLNQLLDAVGYAHNQGVVHRDIKPDNIFITPEGRVKLGDFGIAHVDSGNKMTRFNAVLGSPGYMSPEQAQGGLVTEQSDLFSIGVVAFEMFAGYSPFGAEDGCGPTTLMYRIAHESPRDLPERLADELPDGVRFAIMTALQKDPGNRPASAGRFKAMLNGGTQGEIPVGPKPHNRPKWLPYVAVSAACIAVIAVLGVSALFGNHGGSVAYHSVSSTAAAEGPDSGAATSEVKSSVDDYSWEELSAISARIAASDSDLTAIQIARDYGLCDSDGKLDGTQKKELTLSDGTTVAAQVIGFRHDERRDGGMAGISFLLDTSVAQRCMNASGLSDGGWKSSDLRVWLNDDFLSELPGDLQDAIVSVEKTTNAVGQTPYAESVLEETADYLWLPSARELCGPINWATGKKAKAGANDILNAEGEIYSLYDDLRVNGDGNNSVLSRTTDSGDWTTWWLRSVRSSEPGCFYYVDRKGKPHCYDGLADASMGVVPGFCI